MDVANLARSLESALDYHLFDIARTPITVATIITFSLIVVVTLLFSMLTQRALERVFRSRGVRVILLTDFGSSSVDWEVSVWIDDPWTVRKRRSDLNEAIWWALKQAGITIAFPQLDVHFDPPVNDALCNRMAG